MAAYSRLCSALTLQSPGSATLPRGFDVVTGFYAERLPSDLCNPKETCRWVKGCLSQNSIPAGALLVGCDADHEEVYAGRAEHEGDVVPAVIVPSKNACFISHSGEEVPMDRFEVLVPAKLCWQVSYEGAVPPAAVQAGLTEDGEKLYYGRVALGGATIPGKIQPSLGACIYSVDGEEMSASEYECLVFV